MTRERYSLTVRLRGRIFISSIVYFSWTAARGWRMIFPLSLSSSRVPLSSILPPVGRQTQAGWWRWEVRRSRGYAFQLGDGLCSAERRSPLHSTRFLSIPRWQIALWHHRGRILGEGGGEGIEPWDDVCQPLDNRAAEIHAPRTFRKQGNREMIGADLYGERNCSLGSLPFRSTRLFVNK